MAWYDDLVEKAVGAGGDLIDAYSEAEAERVSPEPANTANAPTQNATASAAKYSDVAAANAVDQQAAAANAANATFIDKYGKWLAVGGGTVAVLGVFVIAMKGK
jgi:branched-subunit amino acid aminotransferase/4-amino-4-deoxychorismate lyase